jgi:hypothetical protein
VPTCVDGKVLHADPPAVELAKDGAVLRERVAPVVMVAENCMEHRAQIRILNLLQRTGTVNKVRLTVGGWCTCVPGLLEALGGVDVGERLLEGLVVDAGEAALVEVVADINDEVDVHLLPYYPHLQTKVDMWYSVRFKK